MLKKTYEWIKAHLNLATVTVACLVIAFIFLFALPDPANAVMFIFGVCVVLYYIVWQLYTFKKK